MTTLAVQNTWNLGPTSHRVNFRDMDLVSTSTGTVLYATNGSSGGVVNYLVNPTIGALSYIDALTLAPLASVDGSAHLETVTFGGQDFVVNLGRHADGLEAIQVGAGANLDTRVDLVGTDGASISSLVFHAADTRDVAYASYWGSSDLGIYQVGANGAMNLLGQINGAFDSQGADLTGFQVTQVQGQDVLVFASTEQDAVYSYTINANGGLAVADVLRMSDGLPVDTPTAMEIIENGGQRFVVLAAAGTSSLTNDAIPVREMQRKYGAVSLVSAKGMMLIETSAVLFDFNNSNLIAPHMTVQNDQLGALFVDGDEIDGLSTTGPLSGGRLQALFQTRDQTAPLVQAQLDDFALDLATRFHGLPADDVGAASAAGLFSDQGSRVDALNSTGLAGRLQLNAAVDPELGGQLWRLRSGITAPGETPSGDATLISNMIDALSEQRPGNGSIFNHVTTVVSSAALRASEFEQAQSFASSECEQLYQLHLENGVNTDAELQKLLLIETNYAANAKMMQTIDEMFAAIMRIS